MVALCVWLYLLQIIFRLDNYTQEMIKGSQIEISMEPNPTGTMKVDHFKVTRNR